MRLLGQEFKSFKPKTGAYIAAAQEDIRSWQDKAGAWPAKRWIKSSEGAAYATAFSCLILGVDEGRLSIFNRGAPLITRTPPPQYQRGSRTAAKQTTFGAVYSSFNIRH